MWIVVFFCAALGASLSVRYKVFALVPAGLVVFGLTVVCGVASHSGVLGIILATIANVIILQVSYCAGGLGLQFFGKTSSRKALKTSRPYSALRRV
jgi:hypothetical protein